MVNPGGHELISPKVENFMAWEAHTHSRVAVGTPADRFLRIIIHVGDALPKNVPDQVRGHRDWKGISQRSGEFAAEQTHDEKSSAEQQAGGPAIRNRAAVDQDIVQDKLSALSGPDKID